MKLVKKSRKSNLSNIHKNQVSQTTSQKYLKLPIPLIITSLVFIFLVVYYLFTFLYYYGVVSIVTEKSVSPEKGPFQIEALNIDVQMSVCFKQHILKIVIVWSKKICHIFSKLFTNSFLLLLRVCSG